MKMTRKPPNGLFFPIRILAFWIVLFQVFRVVFILQNRPKTSSPDVWQSLQNGLILDASTAAWAAAIPILCWVLSLFWPQNGLKSGAFWISRAIIVLFSTIGLANILLYRDWSAVINRRAIMYLKTPRAMLDSMTNCQLFGSLGLLFFVWLFFGKIFIRMVAGGGFLVEKGRVVWKIFGAILTILFTFLLLRGSVGEMPINESAVYFSPNSFSNHAAVNPVWHLGHDLVETRATSNPFIFYEEKIAKQYVSALFPPEIVQPKESELGKKNIVILMMESMASQMFDDSARTPNLHQIAREGVLFSDIYGSGFRTDQGIVAVLSGYPAQPDQSILMLSDKAEKLPSLPSFFANNNYSTLFCYGGELTFANLGMYLRTQKFQKIVSKSDFLTAEKTQKWGADDRNMLRRFGQELDELRPPFFATALTLSQHPPFDLPEDEVISGLSKPDKFRRSAVFADQAIGDFFRNNALKPWFQQTIFVLVADHGNSLPHEIPIEQAEARRVPLIFFGAGLPTDFSKKWSSLPGCQHDIPATILGLFGAQSIDYQWSKNLFLTHATPKFGYWSNEQSLGWRDSTGVSLYDFTAKKWKSGAPKPEALGYLQALYTDFLGK